MIWRLIKVIIYMAVLAGVGLVAYAYIGPFFFPADFAAPSTEIRVPVVLEAE